MEHQTEQKTQDVEAKLFEQKVKDNMNSAFSLPRNKRNSRVEANPKQPVKDFDNACTPTKNKGNLSMDTTMVDHYLAKVWHQVLGHNEEPKNK